MLYLQLCILKRKFVTCKDSIVPTFADDSHLCGALKSADYECETVLCGRDKTGGRPLGTSAEPNGEKKK